MKTDLPYFLLKKNDGCHRCPAPSFQLPTSNSQLPAPNLPQRDFISLKRKNMLKQIMEEAHIFFFVFLRNDGAVL